MKTRPEFLALALLAACSSTTYNQPPVPGDDGPPAAESVDDAVEAARLELEIARSKAEDSRRNAEWKVAEHRAQLEEARTALAHFEASERPTKEAAAVLSLDRARYRAEEAESELRELEAMYAEEEFAATTKELVLKRGRMQREFARRDLEIKGAELEALRGRELPRREQELALAVRKAELNLAEAESALARTELETRLDLMKKEKGLAEAQEKGAK